jgi:hypothetical protein
LFNESGIRDRVVDASVFLQGRLEQRQVVAVVAGVAFLEVDCFGGRCFDDFFSARCIDVAKDDLCASGVQELDSCRADPVRATCVLPFN